jgi:hypothetical protein
VDFANMEWTNIEAHDDSKQSQPDH